MTTCEHCSVERDARTVFFEMKPGKDGVAWYLCIRCWLDGVRPMYKNDPIAVDIVKPMTPKKRKGRTKAA